jgi:hypothetical protein
MASRIPPYSQSAFAVPRRPIARRVPTVTIRPASFFS